MMLRFASVQPSFQAITTNTRAEVHKPLLALVPADTVQFSAIDIDLGALVEEMKREGKPASKSAIPSEELVALRKQLLQVEGDLRRGGLSEKDRKACIKEQKRLAALIGE